MRICALIEIEFFFLMPWFKGTWIKLFITCDQYWIDGTIVKNFLECILVLLREDGDHQPLILQTKLILNRRGSRINADRFLNERRKRKLLGAPGACSPGKCFRF